MKLSTEVKVNHKKNIFLKKKEFCITLSFSAFLSTTGCSELSCWLSLQASPFSVKGDHNTSSDDPKVILQKYCNIFEHETKGELCSSVAFRQFMLEACWVEHWEDHGVAGLLQGVEPSLMEQLAQRRCGCPHQWKCLRPG